MCLYVLKHARQKPAPYKGYRLLQMGMFLIRSVHSQKG